MKYIFETRHEIEAKRMQRSMDMALVLLAIDEHLKHEYKYNENLSEEVSTYVYDLRLVFGEIAESYDIDIHTMVE